MNSMEMKKLYKTIKIHEKVGTEKIKQLAKSSHYIDIVFRDSGKNKIVEADFLREYLSTLM